MKHLELERKDTWCLGRCSILRNLSLSACSSSWANWRSKNKFDKFQRDLENIHLRNSLVFSSAVGKVYLTQGSSRIADAARSRPFFPFVSGLYKYFFSSRWTSNLTSYGGVALNKGSVNLVWLYWGTQRCLLYVTYVSPIFLLMKPSSVNDGSIMKSEARSLATISAPASGVFLKLINQSKQCDVNLGGYLGAGGASFSNPEDSTLIPGVLEKAMLKMWKRFSLFLWLKPKKALCINLVFHQSMR